MSTKTLTLVVNESYTGATDGWTVAQLVVCAKHGIGVCVLVSPEIAARMRDQDADRAENAGPTISKEEATALLSCCADRAGRALSDMFPGAAVLVGQVERTNVPAAAASRKPPMDPQKH